MRAIVFDRPANDSRAVASRARDTRTGARLDLDVLAVRSRIVLVGNPPGAALDPLPAASRPFAANATG